MNMPSPSLSAQSSPLVIDALDAAGEFAPEYRDLILNRFGFSGPRLPLGEHGLVFGVTRERIRQIEERFVLRYLGKRCAFQDFVGRIASSIAKAKIAFKLSDICPDLISGLSDESLLALINAAGFSDHIVSRDAPAILSCLDRSFFVNRPGDLRDAYDSISKTNGPVFPEALVGAWLSSKGFDGKITREEGLLVLSTVVPHSVVVRSGPSAGLVLSLQKNLGASAARCVYENCSPMTFDEISRTLNSDGVEDFNPRTLRNACTWGMRSLPGGLFSVVLPAQNSSALSLDRLAEVSAQIIRSRLGYLWTASEISLRLSEAPEIDSSIEFADASSVAMALHSHPQSGVVSCGRSRFKFGVEQSPSLSVMANEFFVDRLESEGRPLDFQEITQGIEAVRAIPKQISDSYGRIFRLSLAATSNKSVKSVYGLKNRDLPFKEERLRELEDFVAINKKISISEINEQFSKFSSLLPKESAYLNAYGAIGPLFVNPFIKVLGGSSAQVRINRYGASLREVCGSYIAHHGSSEKGFTFAGLKAFLVSGDFVFSSADLRYWLDSNPYLKEASVGGGLKLVGRPNAKSYFSFF